MSDPEMPEMNDEEQELVSAPFAMARGPKGEQGEQGARGERGLPKGQRRAIVFLFVFNFVLIVIGYLFLSSIARGNTQARCASIAKTVAIPVPVPVKDNPSRQWVAAFSLIQRVRGTELGCDMPPPKFVTIPP